MNDYKETFIGPIPADWDLVKLNRLATKITDGTHKTPTYTKSGINFLRVTDIKTGTVDWSNTKYVSEDEHIEMCRRCKPEFGDILYSKNGTIGVPKVIDWDKEFSIFVSLCLIKPIHQLVNNKFLEQYLYSSSCKRQIDRRSKQGTVTNLHLEEIRELDIPLPSLPEQKKIAKILSTVDNHIDEVDGMIQGLKELKKGLMQKLLAEGIGHTEFKDSPVGRIPIEWEVRKLYDCIDKVLDYRGRTPKKLGLDWGNGDIPALSANNVKMGKVDFSLPTYYGSKELYNQWMKDAPLEMGDVLMTMEAPLGNIAQVPSQGKYILSQRVVAFKSKDIIINNYLRYVLMSPRFQADLDRYSTGTTAKGINQKNLSKLYITLPTLLEQREIAKILRSIDNRIMFSEEQKADVINLKKGLMQQLLTGKTRVKVDE